MTSALSLLAVQNAPVLRALDRRPEGGWTLSDLAAHIGRDKSNLSKTLSRLEDEGLARSNPLTFGLTDAGLAQLTMIDRAEGATSDEPGSPDGLVWLRHAQIQPDPDNARRDWDSSEAVEALDALRADIVANGLLQNLVVRGPDANGQYILVGGERRWRAIGAAIADGDIEFDTPFACRLLETDDLGYRLAALAENLQRRNLNPLEKAKAYEGLAEAGLSNKDIADRIGATPEHVQQHRRFLQLDEADQLRMTLPRDDPRHLSVRDARQKLANRAQDAESAAAQAEQDARITPEIRLAMAEFAHRLAGEANYTYADLAVAAEARSHPVAMALSELGWMLFSEAPNTYGNALGYHSARISYTAVNQLPAWRNSTDVAQRDAGLADAYAALGIDAPSTGYVTAWLNPPTEPTPEGAVIIAEARARVRAAEARTRQEEEDRKARAARWARARQTHAALLAAKSAEAADITRTTRDVAEAVDHPLPWAMTASGVIQDANGETVTRLVQWGLPDDQDMTVAQIIILSVNHAAGLETPPVIAAQETADAEENGAAEEEDGHEDGDADQ